jgi:hypothetical protein
MKLLLLVGGISMVLISRKPAKTQDINRRHSVKLNGAAKRKLEIVRALISRVNVQLQQLPANRITARRKARRYIRKLAIIYVNTGYIAAYEYISYKLPGGERITLDTNRFNDGEFEVNFRFSRGQLRTLYALLEIPAKFRIPISGNVLLGEEVFLMALYRAADGERLIKMQKIFGVYHSTIGQGIKEFVRWFKFSWGYLIYNNKRFWKPYFLESAKAIYHVLVEKYDCDFLVEPGNPGGLRVAEFIDCKVIPSDRTGGGPMTSGEAAMRWPTLIQRAFYNGYGKVHGLKKQASVLANGCVEMVSIPSSLPSLSTIALVASLPLYPKCALYN